MGGIISRSGSDWSSYTHSYDQFTKSRVTLLGFDHYHPIDASDNPRSSSISMNFERRGVIDIWSWWSHYQCSSHDTLSSGHGHHIGPVRTIAC